MADFTVTARLRAQNEGTAAVSQFESELAGLERTALETGRELGRAGEGARAFGAGANNARGQTVPFVVTLGDVQQAVAQVKDALVGAVETLAAWADKAGESEATTQRITTSLKAYGEATHLVVDDLNDFVEAQAAKTTADDDAIRSGVALLASVTKNADQIKAATIAAQDYAAATGTDLQSSFEKFTRAIEGSTGGLERYLGQIDDSLTPSEKFAEIIKRVNEQMGGSAAAQVDTYKGSIQQLKKAVDDAEESIGQKIIANTALQTAIAAVTFLIKDATGQETELSRARKESGEATNGLTAAERVRAASLEKIRAALVENATEEQRANELAKQAEVILKSLGVTSEKVATESIARLAKEQATLQAAFDAGDISAKNYAAGLAAVNEKLAAIPGTAQAAAKEIKALAEQAVADQEKLAASFQQDDARAELEETTSALEEQTDAVNEAAQGWITLSQARSADPRSDVEIAQQNLDAFRALGPFASTIGGGSTIGVEGALERRLAEARHAESGVTIAIGRTSFGQLGGGTRSAKVNSK